MITIKKQNCIITKMSFEETGIVSPILMIALSPIMDNGWNMEDAKQIKTLMDSHTLTQNEAEKTHKENLEWI